MNIKELKAIIRNLPDDMEIYGAHSYEWDVKNLFPLVIVKVENLYPNSKSRVHNVLRLEVSTL